MKNIDRFNTTSKCGVQTLPEYKIPYQDEIKKQLINDINQINNNPNEILRPNNTIQNHNNLSQTLANRDINQKTNINKQIIINQQNYKNVQLLEQKQTQNNQFRKEAYLEENNSKLKLPSRLIPPLSNQDFKNQIYIKNQQEMNNFPQQSFTIAQKINPINNNNNNILKSSPNQQDINHHITYINKNLNKKNTTMTNKPNPNGGLFQIPNCIKRTDNSLLEEPLNNNEINTYKQEYINVDMPQNTNIRVKKINPAPKDLRKYFGPLEQQNNSTNQNRQILPPKIVNINTGQNPNSYSIPQQNLYESQQQRIVMNPQQNLNRKENMINMNQNDNNMNLNINHDNINDTNTNSNRINMNQTPKIVNNTFSPDMNINQNLNQSIISNNILQNMPEIREKQSIINDNNNINKQSFKYQNEDDIYIINEPIHIQQIPNNTIFGNILIKDGKAYYLNPIPNININQNININSKEYYNQQPNKIPNNQMTNQQNFPNNIITQNNIINNKSQTQNNQIIYKDQKGNIISNQKPPQQQIPMPQTNNQPKLRGGNIKKKKLSRVAKLLQEKAPKEKKQAVQYQIERNRPVYAVPPSKKRSVSQGKPFTLINKYYDENYILEDDKEEDDKNEEINNIHVEKNMSDYENDEIDDDEKSSN